MDSEDLNSNRIKHGPPSKKFKARNSVLTDLLENAHIRVIYNLAWVIVVTSQFRFLLDNYFTYGRFALNLEVFKISFAKPFQLLYIWVCIFLAALLPYFGFVLWATIRNKIKKLSISFFDRLSLTLFVLYLATYTYCFAFIIYQNDFKPAAALALLLELVRLKMKFYAFVRSNVPRARKFKYHSGAENEILYPSISKYLYFLFAPTLIYQDKYPRSKSIRWRKVAEHFGNFGGSLLLGNIMLEHGRTQFEIFSRNPFKWSNFLIIAIEFAPLSGFLLLITNYSFFHCWLNAFAEMLRFSDRLFYKEFWMCTSFGSFFKTWNGIVQEWLYVYVYKDFYEIVWPNNKFFAKAVVLTVSALYHEFIMGLAFNLFPQYLFVLFFLLNVILTVILQDKVVGNFVFLLGAATGPSILACAFGTRYYYENMK